MCQNGFFATRLKYLNLRRKKLQNAINASCASNSSVCIDASNEAEDLDFLKSVVVEDSNFYLIVQKLNSTRELRQRMLLSKETDLRENFPFLFAHPKLVSQTFIYLVLVFSKYYLHCAESNSIKFFWVHYDYLYGFFRYSYLLIMHHSTRSWTITHS